MWGDGSVLDVQGDTLTFGRIEKTSRTESYLS